ncbi:13240_t:CDS:2 [Ambispora gerdemannii]|uniref:13240_t:CDS:1 n=1 Tax=Ambispora gerdemannii TaxID=144530 RepID=A0A9N9FLV2_9GLOM|nr:13240_t:CDS:2 [Ambispora gerdemannii]
MRSPQLTQLYLVCSRKKDCRLLPIGTNHSLSSKKTRLYASAVGPHTTINNYNDRSTRDFSPPPVKQMFSFSDGEQGAVVEPLINLVEKVLYKFLVNNESIIPADVVESLAAEQRPLISTDFSNADFLYILNFITEKIDIFLKKSVFHGQYKANPVELFNNFKNVCHKMTHGIVVNEVGRWSDHALQHVALLACGNYEEVYITKEGINNDVGDNGDQPPKRKLEDTDFGKMAEFVLDVLDEVEDTEKGQKIMKLTLKEDKYFMQIWRRSGFKRITAIMARGKEMEKGVRNKIDVVYNESKLRRVMVEYPITR